MIKLGHIKIATLLLLLIYGYRVAEFSGVETVFKGKEWAAIRYSKAAAKTVSTLIYVDNCHNKSCNIFQKYITHLFDLEPSSRLLDTDIRSYLRRNIV